MKNISVILVIFGGWWFCQALVNQALSSSNLAARHGAGVQENMNIYAIVAMTLLW